MTEHDWLKEVTAAELRYTARKHFQTDQPIVAAKPLIDYLEASHPELLNFASHLVEELYGVSGDIKGQNSVQHFMLGSVAMAAMIAKHAEERSNSL